MRSALGGAGRTGLLGRRTTTSTAPARVRDHDGAAHVRVDVALEVVLAWRQRGDGVLRGRGPGDELPVEQLVAERAVRVDRDVVLHTRVLVLERDRRRHRLELARGLRQDALWC